VTTIDLFHLQQIHLEEDSDQIVANEVAVLHQDENEVSHQGTEEAEENEVLRQGEIEVLPQDEKEEKEVLLQDEREVAHQEEGSQTDYLLVIYLEVMIRQVIEISRIYSPHMVQLFQ